MSEPTKMTEIFVAPSYFRYLSALCKWNLPIEIIAMIERYASAYEYAIVKYRGIIPISDHDREHGIMYADPTSNVHRSDCFEPAARVMIAPEQLVGVHHYDVEFSYEGTCHPVINEAKSVVNGLLNRFYATTLFSFSAAPCSTTTTACRCYAPGSTYAHSTWNIKRANWTTCNIDGRVAIWTFLVHDNAIRDRKIRSRAAAANPSQTWNNEESRRHYEVDCVVEWTVDELAARWERILAVYAQDCENVLFHQRQITGERGPVNFSRRSGSSYLYEQGYPWISALFSTGMNGTNHRYLCPRASYVRSMGARAMAQKIFDITCAWPGWRTMELERSGTKFRIALHGGRRDD